MASNNWSQSNHSRGHAQTGMGRDSVTNADATRSTMGETPNLSRRTGSGGYPEQSAQIISNGPGVGIVVPGQSIGPALTFSFNGAPDPLPAVMSQYWAGRGKITSLQAEQEYLKRMINSLTSHSILHDDYCGFVLPSQYDKSEKVKGAREGLSLSNEKYMDLVVAHCNSLRGEYADNYYGLFLEYTVLQKLYRSAVASIAVTRYHAQRLVIKAGRLYYPSPAVTSPVPSSHIALQLPDQTDILVADRSSPPDLSYPPEEFEDAADSHLTFPISYIRSTAEASEAI